ncbi:MAG: ABC transporter ATP-binding protein, partial [Planctomycetaceae bacterium]|nr:ABC transporter ATP-binding protein [Planctomycetaceae bacterium]
MTDHPSTADDVISFRDVVFRFTAGDTDVIRIPRLTVRCGEFISVLGASGCGKSTLLRLVAGLLHPVSGTLDVMPDGDTDRRRQRQQVAAVFQSPTLIPWRTVRDNIRLPAELGPSAVSRPEVTDPAVVDILTLAGLQPAVADKRPAELSGGMQMRVALARALVTNPALLLLDEPFAALDDLLRMQLETDVRHIHESRGLTTVLVTHNIAEAVFMSDRVLILGGSPSTVAADVAISLTANAAEHRGLLRD